MTLMDPLADALTNLRNNELQVNNHCTISPASKLIGQVLSTMQKENYIDEFEYIDDNKAGKFEVELDGNINQCGVIKPRHAVKKDEFE
ncbi:30S ribosomal protein S8, partial [Methanobrevibacter sp. UBA46]